MSTCYQNQPDQMFYLQLAKLEKQMYESPNLETFTMAIQMYRKCVEYFDSQTNPIKYYFIEKIQQSISETKTLMMIINSKPQLPKIEKIDSLTSSPEKLIQAKKNRAKQVQMVIKLNEIVDCQSSMTNTMIKQFSDQTDKQDQLIREQMSIQDHNFADRLLRRQQSKKFMSQCPSQASISSQISIS